MGDAAILEARHMILDTTVYRPSGGDTAYHALIEHQANSLGLALTMSLLCQQSGIPCTIIEGTLNGVPHTWNIVSTVQGQFHLDLTQSQENTSPSPFCSDEEMAASGYLWDNNTVPSCTAEYIP